MTDNKKETFEYYMAGMVIHASKMRCMAENIESILLGQQENDSKISYENIDILQWSWKKLVLHQSSFDELWFDHYYRQFLLDERYKSWISARARKELLAE
ncbi:MAG: hypothetical protein DHS20C02_12070 [Micavibrio sp.]|nr:MAG: hypothetical protein DHS20C02_12070 [Micavibrio sp.]